MISSRLVSLLSAGSTVAAKAPVRAGDGDLVLPVLHVGFGPVFYLPDGGKTAPA